MTRQQRENEQKIERATAWVTEYLAKLAGRPRDAVVPVSERKKTFGENIVFAPVRANDAFLLATIGYQNNGAGYQDYLDLPIYRQAQIVDQMMDLAGGNEIERRDGKLAATNPITFWDAVDELFKNLACNGKLTSSQLCQRAAQFRVMDRPANKRGLSRPEVDQRKALILNLMHVLTSDQFGLSVTHNPLNPHSQNACGVIAKVCQQEFRADKAAYSEAAITKVWNTRSHVETKV
tara:strand:- start:9309 stop:10013 length:705 start_codon:yes stop_codon:yes gene_type:complete